MHYRWIGITRRSRRVLVGLRLDVHSCETHGRIFHFSEEEAKQLLGDASGRPFSGSGGGQFRFVVFGDHKLVHQVVEEAIQFFTVRRDGVTGASSAAAVPSSADSTNRCILA